MTENEMNRIIALKALLGENGCYLYFLKDNKPIGVQKIISSKDETIILFCDKTYAFLSCLTFDNFIVLASDLSVIIKGHNVLGKSWK